MTMGDEIIILFFLLLFDDEDDVSQRPLMDVIGVERIHHGRQTELPDVFDDGRSISVRWLVSLP